MSDQSTGMICPSCGEMSYFNELSMYFKDGKAECKKCGYEFKKDKPALEQQVLLYLKKFSLINAVMFYNKATNAGLAESKQEVERIAQANGIPIPKSKCFIATAAYGTDQADEVIALQIYRDAFLLRSFLGKIFVKSYYRISPPIARSIAGSDILKKITRSYIIKPLLGIVKRISP